MQLINLPATAVITGVNGQLGQFMAKYLLDNEPNVKVIGTMRHKSYQEQPWIFDKSRITIELLDITDTTSVERIVSLYRPHFFINTVANAFVGESWHLPVNQFSINTIGVINCLESIRKISPTTRFITSGTSEEFSTAKYVPQDEKHPLVASSPYGASKIAARYIVDVWRKSYGLYALQPWTFNFESELRGPKYFTGKVAEGIARIYHSIKNGNAWKPIEVGNLNSKRSWQFAGDVAKAFWLMLNQEMVSKQKAIGHMNAKDETKYLSKHISEYVVSAPDSHEIREFISLGFAAAGFYGGKFLGEGLDEKFVTQGITFTTDSGTHGYYDLTDRPMVVVSKEFFRPHDVTNLYGDATRIKNELGWNSTLDFPALVDRMVKFKIEKYNQHV